MRVMVRLIGSAGVMLALCAAPVFAANGAGGEVAGGYSYMYDSDISTSFPGGWFFSAGANITDVFGIVGDVSGNYKSESATSGTATATASLKVHTYLAGPRVTGRSGRARFFAQFLVGAATASAGVTASSAGTNIAISDSTTEFCYAPGAGVDIDLTRAAAVRVAANEHLIRSNGNTSKEFQLELGLAYRFGK